ncbi:hypothetical protein CORC01_01087 [Colletotrichum orchidophilum]|uniref:Uncharacterized protein n=1 Tax=Colletotrichum orchidophilum TaxID=1209926 RepID=A0A1G4BR05_9PEZI|nr:uncharacterized protein CORC01_01087 [Colletotrichum orchidophilum]OHF03768.1 hypothetical protein CORC01_01087 [Colletotrichum orchidophilum]
MHFFSLIVLASTALAAALPEPQECNPYYNCCTYKETPCNNRGDHCTATCNEEVRRGLCNDLGSGSLSCST